MNLIKFVFAFSNIKFTSESEEIDVFLATIFSYLSYEVIFRPMF